MSKDTFPKFTAETLKAALPESLIERHTIVITENRLHIGHRTIKISENHEIDNSDHTVRLENISSVTEADSIVMIYFDRWCLQSCTLSKISDTIHFNL
jgi:hypothetical protein